MLHDASFDVIWQINLIHFQAPFQQNKRGGGLYLNSCLPDSHLTLDTFKFNWRILNILTLGFYMLVKAFAKLSSKGHFSWPPENRSVSPKGNQGPRLGNPDLDR